MCVLSTISSDVLISIIMTFKLWDILIFSIKHHQLVYSICIKNKLLWPALLLIPVIKWAFSKVKHKPWPNNDYPLQLNQNLTGRNNEKIIQLVIEQKPGTPSGSSSACCLSSTGNVSTNTPNYFELILLKIRYCKTLWVIEPKAGEKRQVRNKKMEA